MVANLHGYDWYRQAEEPAIDPGRKIIDPHFHFFSGFGHNYLAEDLLADVGGGHNVVAMVYVEGNADFFKMGGATGEVRFAITEGARMRAMQNSRNPICDPVAGIVAYADLRAPDIDDQLDALAMSAEGRLRGIRNTSAWDASPEVRNGHTKPPQGMLADPKFIAGLRRLARRNLTFDSLAYHPQISELAALARQVPEATIVCNHLGGPIGVGPYKNKMEDFFGAWKIDMSDLASCQNVLVKLGGMAMSYSGWDWHKRASAPSSEEYFSTYYKWYDHAINAFGPGRCMFEGNFPVDKVSISYGNLWNAFKKIASDLSSGEKEQLFFSTASRAYRLSVDSADSR